MTNENIINKPKHYNIGKIQPSDFVIDQKLDIVDGQIVLYITRAKHKSNEVEDKFKALWWLIKSLIVLVGKDETLRRVNNTLEYFKNEKCSIYN